MRKRVVITGMDIVSSIGTGLEKFWDAAKCGTSGVKTIQNYDASPYTTRIAGEITDFSLDHLPQFDKNRRYTRVVQYALYCAHHALARAGLTKADLLHAGTFIGTSLGGHPELEGVYETFYQEGWKKISPFTVIKGMPNSVANYVAIAFGLGGTNSTISNACISSAEAISNAYQHIAEGRLFTAVCGGTDSLLWETSMAAWCKLRVLSTNNDNPSGACRPFDHLRDGLVMADGAGMLVLEELQQARARGAAIYGEIIGVGSSCDAFHITAPESAGQARAIMGALDNAKLSPNDVHYINAHGTATQLNDITETATIKSVFGEYAYDIPITAQKSMTGHAIGASGAMEIIATALCLQEDVLLPTINLNNPDPNCDLDYVANHSRKKKIAIALSNHFAFGGSNVAIVLAKYIA